MKKLFLTILLVALLAPACATFNCNPGHPKAWELAWEMNAVTRANPGRLDRKLLNYCIMDKDAYGVGAWLVTRTVDGKLQHVLVVTPRLLETVPTRDMLFCVCAHELAHVVLKHTTDVPWRLELEFDADLEAISLMRSSKMPDPEGTFVAMLEWVKRNGNENSGKEFTLWRTHPPIDERIARIKSAAR